MKSYYFYFDESFHSRTITEGAFNDSNFFNSYVSTGIGFEKKNQHNILNDYKEFDNKYSLFYTVDELKSEIVKQKNYERGLASFNKDSVRLYTDFFELLYRNDVLYYISSIDKLEYLLSECKYTVPPFINVSAMIYSITKIVNVYKPKKVIDDIMNKSNSLLDDLKDFFSNQLKINGELKLKELENIAMNNIMIFLNGIDVSSINYEFDYSFTYHGLNKLLNELKISNVSLIIDKEGSNKIVGCAKKEGFLDSRQMDSKNSLGVRTSDMFCGFISRMMRAIYNSLYFDSGVPYNKRRLIPIGWFDIRENNFHLYKTVAKYIKKQANIYYCTFMSLYSDLFSVFIGILYYFDEFETYEDYKNVSVDVHFDECNNFVVSRINHDIKRIENNYMLF
ncbi:MAG: hypothetical protein IJA30_02585 [Bacilli bacterium]|nr:hypothetical protein [Bacilli bacterium]